MFLETILLILSILFSSILKLLSHPNFIVVKGISFFVWLQYVPVLLIFKKINVKKTVIYGFLYGFFSYFLLCSWLLAYSCLAGIAVFILFGFYWALTFVALKLNEKYINSFFINAIVIFISEYIVTKGYLGFGYGVSSYALWKNSLFLAGCKTAGIWLLNFFIIFINCFAAELIVEHKKIRLNLKNIFSILFIFAFLLFNLFCLKNQKDNYSEKLAVVLIQNNADPWQEGIDQYFNELHALMKLTDEALEKHPDTKLVVWPESAVVVDVINHYKMQSDSKRYKYAEEFFEYINNKKCGILTGNNYFEYNSAVLFEKNQSSFVPEYQVYCKNHLVPFSEDFPFKRVMKGLYSKMLENGNAFWKKGNQLNLLSIGDVLIGTPVCFEDSFPEIAGIMKNSGAELFVNITNDSWSNSLACQFQHLSMACFRSAENNVPTVRAANSGQTCYIDNHGKIVKMLEPFTENWLYCEVTLNKVR